MSSWLPLLLLLVGALSVPLVHEGGHLLAAWLVGGKRLRVERSGLTFAVSADLPERLCAVRAFYAGGPLANVVAGVGFALSGRASLADGALAVTCLGAALVHLAFALVNLLPLAGHDGRALLGGARVSGSRSRRAAPPRSSSTPPAAPSTRRSSRRAPRAPRR